MLEIMRIAFMYVCFHPCYGWPYLLLVFPHQTWNVKGAEASINDHICSLTYPYVCRKPKGCPYGYSMNSQGSCVECSEGTYNDIISIAVSLAGARCLRSTSIRFFLIRREERPVNSAPAVVMEIRRN